MKNMFFVLLAVTFFALNIITVSTAQSEETASDEKFKSYEEQFNNNDGQWEIYNMTMASAQIKDGEYHIENKSDTGELFLLHHAEFPFGEEFVIETAIKAVKALDKHSYGFVFGARDAGYNYAFLIINNESYSIRKYERGMSEELAGGEVRERFLNKDSFNALKLEMLGGTVRFYINGSYINEISDISLFGGRLGFLIEGKSEIAVDYTRSQIWTK
ncbi:MAG TPA: hypothetical protein ENH40_05720 [Nitrospirae bacterium]|nr:hypothetical protein [Nitrospirota bacterium]